MRDGIRPVILGESACGDDRKPRSTAQSPLGDLQRSYEDLLPLLGSRIVFVYPPYRCKAALPHVADASTFPR